LNSFLQLSAEDVTKYWDHIKDTVIDISQPTAVQEEAKTNILKGIMTGYMDCWILSNEQKVGAVLTTLMTNEPTGQRLLFVHSLHITKGTTEEMLKDLIDGLRRLARGKGCTGIVHFTRNRSAARIVEHFGGDASTIMLRLEV
jgi:hypothetical protein